MLVPLCGWQFTALLVWTVWLYDHTCVFGCFLVNLAISQFVTVFTDCGFVLHIQLWSGIYGCQQSCGCQQRKLAISGEILYIVYENKNHEHFHVRYVCCCDESIVVWKIKFHRMVETQSLLWFMLYTILCNCLNALHH